MSSMKKAWELRPGKDSHHSILTINGALVLLKIEISEKGACILSINHGDSAVFQHLCGSFMAPWQLVQKLSSVGINILAEDNGFQHIGVQPKDFWAEDWTYFCMSLLSSFCIFSWSRWNSTATSEQLVMKGAHLMTPGKASRKSKPPDEKKKEGTQEHHGSTAGSKKESGDKERAQSQKAATFPGEELKRKEDDAQKVVPAHVMVTPERAVYLKCGDTAEAFSDEAVDGQVFCSDLYHLMIKDLPEEPISKLEDTRLLFSINVYSLLSLCKVFSCS